MQAPTCWRKKLSGSATDTGPIDQDELGQETTELKLERTTAHNPSVFENWMPPDTRTETTAGIKPRRTNTRRKTNATTLCLNGFIFQACKPRAMRARSGEYLGYFIFFDFIFWF